LLPPRDSNEVEQQLLGEKPENTTRTTISYQFLHEGVLRRFLSWLGREVGDKAVYWRFGCWFRDRRTGIQVIIDSYWEDNPQHPRQGKVTLDAWGGPCASILDKLLIKLKELSPIQKPTIFGHWVEEDDGSGNQGDQMTDIPLLVDLTPEERLDLSKYICLIYLIRIIFDEEKKSVISRQMLADKLEERFKTPWSRWAITDSMEAVEKALGKHLGKRNLKLFFAHHSRGYSIVDPKSDARTKAAWRIIDQVGSKMHSLITGSCEKKS
jgi:hypothetical protein